MKYFIIAGEASGDMHGSNLIKEIFKLDANAEIQCWGGNLMQAAGAKVLKHINDLAFMGFVEVLQNIFAILRNFKLCKKQIIAFEPHVMVYIDYPGFNMRMAKWTFQKGLKNMYYIGPTVWAWKEKRVFKIKKYVHQMMCILPFEKAFYKKFGVDVHYVGNPLMHEVQKFKMANANTEIIKTSKKIIALLPGSRLQEIHTKLPIMLSVVQHFTDYEFVIAQAPNLAANEYQSMIQNYPNVQLVQNNTYGILMQSHAALVTSGTATLETALFEVPQVVCYIGNKISYAIGKQLIKVPYISLVNLIANKKIVAELIQSELTESNILLELKKILDANIRNEMLQNYNSLHSLIGNQNASALTAKIIHESLFEKSSI
jgi:lipid-A-disaccharide synthase